MMGYSHAVFGVTTIPALTLAGALAPQSPAHYALACSLAAGAALLPDLDHPKAKATQNLGPAARFIASVSGGHRHYTHTIWALAAIAVLTWAASLWHTNTWGHVLYPAAGLLVWVLVSIALNTLTNTPRHWARLAAIPPAVIIMLTTPNPLWLTITIGAGYATHLVGDIITSQGLRLLRPIPWCLRVPILGNAGSWREHTLTLLLTLGFVYMTWLNYHP